MSEELIISIYLQKQIIFCTKEGKEPCRRKINFSKSKPFYVQKWLKIAKAIAD
jgi:hypothetical protein